MWIQTILIVSGFLYFGMVNGNCPDYLSKNCVCVENSSSSIRCDFIFNIPIGIINSSFSDSSQVNLTKLDLSRNNISSLPLDFFNQIYSIIEIDLSHNNFDSILIVTKPGMAAKVKKLNMAYNNIRYIDDSLLSKMPALEKLDLSYNSLVRVPDNTFVHNQNLWYLDLSYNNLHTLSSASFNGIENVVRDLDVSGNNIAIVQSNTFSYLHDLKNLKFSNNSISQSNFSLRFPSHLIMLDLSNAGITEMDECRLLELSDLEYINLSGNPLVCACHLSWLRQRLIYNQDTNVLHSTKEHEMDNDWTCKASGNQIISVADLNGQCDDHYYLNIPKHCQLTNENQNKMDTNEDLTLEYNLDLLTEEGDDEVILKWNAYNNSNFYGYDITIFKSGEKIYTSPKLHQSVSEYTAKSEDLSSGKYKVCLNILQNETHTIGKVCNEVSFLDLQIVVGILAGVIFLIPCVVALVYIVCLDKRNFLAYTELSDPAEGVDIEKQSEKSDKKQPVAKFNKSQAKKDTLKIPTIKVQDYTLTSTHSSESIVPEDEHGIPVVRSTERILPDDSTSIETDGDSGSSAGIRIDIKVQDEEPGVTNKAYSEDKSACQDVRL